MVARQKPSKPSLPRNCERGRTLQRATGPIPQGPGKAQLVGRSVSQETDLIELTPPSEGNGF